MKAAVIYNKEGLPIYTDFPEPSVQKSNEVLVSVKAVAIKHFDKGRASGKHYSGNTSSTNGKVIGGDGIGVLEDGTRVYGIGVSGMLAEKAIIDKERMVAIPEGLDDIVAAALPNAVIGAAMALRFKANIQQGDVVLINGATGFTGRVAVQIAKHYGAGKVIVTGRNTKSLADVMELGADQSVAIDKNNFAQFKNDIKAIHAQTPVDVVIDYLWGSTAEMILNCIKGNGSFTNRIRYVSVGSVSGDVIQLSAANLRSVDLQLSGSGLGAWTKQQVRELFTGILPEMFQLAADGKLKVETVKVELENINELWSLDVPEGKRLVVVI